jgi:hypothetical protein
MDDAGLKTLSRQWVHSHEEDGPDTLVFRPETYDFPLSRGRKAFNLLPDGTFQGGVPGADDRQVLTQGRWQVQGRQLSLTSPGSNTSSEYAVESIEPSKLVLKRVDSTEK